MPVFLIGAAVGAGAFWALSDTAKGLTRLALVGGGAYVAYRVLK